MLPLQNAITSHILYDTNLKCNEFASFQQIILIYVLYLSWIIKIYVLKNIGKIYYFNAYYDVIDFIAIYNVLEMALSFMLYIINDVIVCSSIIYFPDIYFLT